MNISFFFKGLVIGFSIAAPVGPIGVLCIRRTLAQGLISGIISGLGAATADAMYGCIAGLGLANTSGDYASAIVLVLGVFIGSAFWWLLLSGGVSLFQAKLTSQRLRWINRISGIIIIMFGFMALLSLTNLKN